MNAGRSIAGERENVDARGSAPAALTPSRLAALVAVLTVGLYAVLLGDTLTIVRYAGEEMFIDTAGAAVFLVAAGVMLLAYLRLRRRRAPGASRMHERFVLGLALVFFVAFGEEVSWGQHALGFEPPETVRRLNQQEEFNLHNLKLFDSREEGGVRKRGLALLLNSNRLFDYAMLGLFVAVPLLRRTWPWAARQMRRFGVAPVPLELGAVLLLNYALTVAAVLTLRTHPFFSRATSEVRETSTALLCLALAVLLWRRAGAAAAD